MSYGTPRLKISSCRLVLTIKLWYGTLVLGRLSSLSPYRTWFTRAVGTGTAQKSCSLAKTENYGELIQGNDSRVLLKKTLKEGFIVLHHRFTCVGSPKVFNNVVALGAYLDINWLFRCPLWDARRFSYLNVD